MTTGWVESKKPWSIPVTAYAEDEELKGTLEVTCHPTVQRRFNIYIHGYASPKTFQGRAVNQGFTIESKEVPRLIARLTELIHHTCTGENSPPGKPCILSNWEEENVKGGIVYKGAINPPQDKA